MTALTGARALTRLTLRRDRAALAAWVLSIAGLAALFTSMSTSQLTTTQEITTETALFTDTPAMRLTGLPTGATLGGYVLIRGYLTLAVLAALMSIFAVVRNTRQDEETGRAELVGSTAVGRHARLAAALTVTVGADVAVALLVAAGMAAVGLPVGGAVVAGAAVGAVGLVLAGVAAVTAQLVGTARGANGLAGAALGVACVLSGVGNMLGDVGDDGLTVHSAWPAWLSPVGWGQQVRAFDDVRLWPLALSLLAFVCLVALAAAVAVRRDFALGVLPGRRGPAVAGRALRGPFGLVWRVERTSALAWGVAMLGAGLLFGSLTDAMTDLGETAREWYTRVGGTDQIVDAFRTSMVQLAAMAAAVYVVQLLLRLRGDELAGRTEVLLAGPVSRTRWLLVHAAHTVLGAVGLLLVLVVGMAVTGGGLEVLGPLAGAGLAQVPAVLALGGLTLALVGLVPRWSATLSWAALGAAVLLGPLFGPGLGTPAWVQDLSPFAHAPKAPALDVTAGPLLALAVVVVVLAAAGLTALRRRDLALPV